MAAQAGSYAVLADSAVDVDLLREVGVGTRPSSDRRRRCRENRIVILGGANGTVTSLGDADRRSVAAADAVLLQLGAPAAGRRGGSLRRGCRRGAGGADSGARQTLPDKLLASTSIVFANEHELTAITGAPDVEHGLPLLLERIPATVVAVLQGGGTPTGSAYATTSTRSRSSRWTRRRPVMYLLRRGLHGVVRRRC